ncbi:hypothetical protein [Methylobacterium aquaticum]|uniref:Uncharacterized protein n=1 Tax=Methylobacterium aquaticum TaxID=270351 RepID=A0A0C6FWR3_9HYPH|nr:hypothetical protein [Methylobacterium aquaticum]BAQ47665.1 hypothetical protein Maq22A_c23580 [Methylobacterium aquaticum]
MRRQTSTTPYQPHSYVDELPNTAWANYGVWRDSLLRGDTDAHALAYGLDAHVFETDARGARIPVLRNPPTLFEDLAVGIYRTADYEARLAAIVAIFGSSAQRDVWFLIKDCVEERDMPAEFHDLQGRILCRVESGTHNAADLAWIEAAAARQVTDDDMLQLDVFGGDEADTKELSRRVVRARREHRCHWTGLPIAVGERHLVIREVCEGDFLVTRHSILAVWFAVYGDDIALSESLRPAEAPLATAA